MSGVPCLFGNKIVLYILREWIRNIDQPSKFRGLNKRGEYTYTIVDEVETCLYVIISGHHDVHG